MANLFDLLPIEITRYIISLNLSLRDLLNTTRLSKTFRQKVYHSIQFWKYLYQRDLSEKRLQKTLIEYRGKYLTVARKKPFQDLNRLEGFNHIPIHREEDFVTFASKKGYEKLVRKILSRSKPNHFVYIGLHHIPSRSSSPYYLYFNALIGSIQHKHSDLVDWLLPIITQNPLPLRRDGYLLLKAFALAGDLENMRKVKDYRQNKDYSYLEIQGLVQKIIKVGGKTDSPIIQELIMQ